ENFISIDLAILKYCTENWISHYNNPFNYGKLAVDMLGNYYRIYPNYWAEEKDLPFSDKFDNVYVSVEKITDDSVITDIERYIEISELLDSEIEFSLKWD